MDPRPRRGRRFSAAGDSATSHSGLSWYRRASASAAATTREPGDTALRFAAVTGRALRRDAAALAASRGRRASEAARAGTRNEARAPKSATRRAWTATRRTRRLGRHRVTRRARRSHAARASTLARRPRNEGPSRGASRRSPRATWTPRPPPRWRRRRLGARRVQLRSPRRVARLPSCGASSRRPAAPQSRARQPGCGSPPRARARTPRAGRRRAAPRAGAAPPRAPGSRARAPAASRRAFQSGDFGDRYESLVGTLGPDVRHSCVLFTDHTGKKSVLGKVRGRSLRMSRDVFARDAREGRREPTAFRPPATRTATRTATTAATTREGCVCPRPRSRAMRPPRTVRGSRSRAVAARVGVNGTARAAGDPNGEPASVSRGPDASPGAVTRRRRPGSGTGPAPPGRATSRRRPRAASRAMRRCARPAGAAPRACRRERRRGRGFEEKEAPAGASPRGAGGDTGGSRRGGIDAATPPPRSRSSESASRVGRDPPPSFLMPVTRFTSRPNFPIAERARDRHPRKPVLADSFRRSLRHPRPRGVSFRDVRDAPLGSRAGAEDDDARSVARRFRSERRMRLGGFKHRGRLPEKREADARQTPFKSRRSL